MLASTLLEKDLLPDTVIRQGIRRLLRQRLREEDKGGPVAQQEHLLRLIEDLRKNPIAVQTQAANEQHWRSADRVLSACARQTHEIQLRPLARSRK